MAVQKKRPTSPPWWVRAPLYAALWPREDLEEYRISLQRQYIRVKRKGDRTKTFVFCMRTSFRWTGVTVFRFKELLLAAFVRAT